MAWEQNKREIGGLSASADMSSNQFKFVKAGPADNQFALCDTDGEFALGVLQDNPVSGIAGAIAVDGVVKVEAAEALAANDFVGTNGSGQAKVVSAGVTAQSLGNWIRGVVLEGAGAAGELATIQLMHGKVEEA